LMQVATPRSNTWRKIRDRGSVRCAHARTPSGPGPSPQGRGRRTCTSRHSAASGSRTHSRRISVRIISTGSIDGRPKGESLLQQNRPTSLVKGAIPLPCNRACASPSHGAYQTRAFCIRPSAQSVKICDRNGEMPCSPQQQSLFDMSG
jgi:hypothetical protein